MQFVHIDQYHVRSIRKDIDRQSKLLKTAWGKIRPTENGGVWGDVDFTFKGVNLRDPFVWDGHKGKGGVLVKLFDKHLIGGSLMLQIADTYEMLNRIKPNIVWVRASVSLQTHFSVLSLVARKLKIPSIEAQHGIEYLGPASATTRHAAENIAVYGNLVRDEYVSRGYSIEHLLVAGSPRFDSYANVVPQKIEPRTDFRILTTIPGINVSERFGSFSVEEHFKALGDALKVVPQAHLEVTSRSVDREAFMHEAMRRGLGKETKYEFAGNDPLPKLFEKADVFVCSFSTVVYEALLHGKPTVIVAFAPLERMMADFHFSKFEQAGALYIARTPEELKNALIQLADPETRARVGASGWDFMQKNFSFDGKASERIAEFIRTQAKAGGAS